jgi:UDP-N-acetylglucosamine:LPS N-acetylglucosamine transferase
LVLFGAIPGQETGNVDLVRETGAGVWAPSPSAVTQALQQWFVAPSADAMRAQAAAAALAAAKPNAADAIVDRVLALAAQRRRRDAA